MIEEYEFGKIKIDGKKYDNDVIIFPDRVESNWWRKNGHNLCMEDLESVEDYGPDMLVIGKGASGLMSVSTGLIHNLEQQGIQVEVYKTRKAAEKFNKYLEEDKDAVGAFHLTC